MSDPRGDFEGRVVLVTGASSGIGRAASIQLAARGAHVVVAARRRDRGEETVSAIVQAGGAAEFLPLDIACQDSINALFAALESRHGRLDAAFNNAGTEGEHAPLPDMPVEEFDRVMNTNVRGTWLCLRHELGIMRAQGRGSVVNTSSIAGVIGYAAASAYTASKHAVVGMTRAASLDFAALGIRVNCLCPGGTSTEMSERWVSRFPGGEAAVAQGVPMKRFGRPEELAAAAVFMLSRRGRVHDRIGADHGRRLDHHQRAIGGFGAVPGGFWRLWARSRRVRRGYRLARGRRRVPKSGFQGGNSCRRRAFTGCLCSGFAAAQADVISHIAILHRLGQGALAGASVAACEPDQSSP